MGNKSIYLVKQFLTQSSVNYRRPLFGNKPTADERFWLNFHFSLWNDMGSIPALTNKAASGWTKQYYAIWPK